ncbi:MAG TPA: UDP-2,3-diacylglucosamine diphosphatase [Longimicrobiales bacterium]|nr:UDP-2,3-diacylglucosamine diphosphatase [Longimicrobiales bacterium]
MESAPVYLASDVHLGAIPRENERAFLAWLEESAADAGVIVLNGDLFDYWFEYRTAIPQGYTRALGLLARVVDAGTPVHLLGGNHDWWGGRYLEEEIGLHFHRDPVRLTLAGRRVLLAHGDGLGPGDHGYKALKTLLRSRVFNWAYRWLHPDLGALVANRASSTEHRGAPTEGEKQRSWILREWALGTLAADRGLDLVVLGHTHIPVLEETDPGRHYLNCGDWVYHRTFAVLEEGRPPRLMEWAASGDHRPYGEG